MGLTLLISWFSIGFATAGMAQHSLSVRYPAHKLEWIDWYFFFCCFIGGPISLLGYLFGEFLIAMNK